MLAIDAQSLSRTFDRRVALDSVTFGVETGEIFGYLGPNGAGKTTTLRILTGQLRPTSGHARLFGFDCYTESDRTAPLFGVVFEKQNLYERMSGRENLRFTARLYGIPQDRVEVVLDQLGLAERGGDRVSTYSNGMKQRLLIGRAILHEPRILFLDEPTSGLDPNAAHAIRAFIAGLPDQGVTVFLTTHLMHEAERLCHRVALLDRGRLVATGTPDDLSTAHEQQSLEDTFIQLTAPTDPAFSVRS